MTVPEKRALILSGGADRGQYHVGAIRTLSQLGFHYPIIAGTSVGAIVGALLAQWPAGDPEGPHELAHIFARVRRSDILRFRPRKTWPHSLYDNTPLRNLLKAHLDFDALRTSGVSLRIPVTALDSGETLVFTNQAPPDTILSALMASSAIPGIFPPEAIDPYGYCCDGSVLSDTPIGAAIRAGATHLDVISLNPEKVLVGGYKMHAWGVAMRSFELIMHQAFESDLRTTRHVNQILATHEFENRKSVKLRVLRPRTSVSSKLLAFDSRAGYLMRTQGEKDAADPDAWTVYG